MKPDDDGTLPSNEADYVRRQVVDDARLGASKHARMDPEVVLVTKARSHEGYVRIPRS